MTQPVNKAKDGAASDIVRALADCDVPRVSENTDSNWRPDPAFFCLLCGFAKCEPSCPHRMAQEWVARNPEQSTSTKIIQRVEEIEVMHAGVEAYRADCGISTKEGFQAHEHRAELIAVVRSMEIERTWRPIDCAPKDATQIIVWCPGFGPRVALWWADAEEWLIAGTDTVCRPTHWQPLLRGP